MPVSPSLFEFYVAFGSFWTNILLGLRSVEILKPSVVFLPGLTAANADYNLILHRSDRFYWPGLTNGPADCQLILLPLFVVERPSEPLDEKSDRARVCVFAGHVGEEGGAVRGDGAGGGQQGHAAVLHMAGRGAS